MSGFGELMQAAADEMKVSLSKARAALPHNLSKGEALEEGFRRFLRDHLPASIGVTSGQVLDSKGAVSKQMDVILYDMAHTPLLYKSADGGHQLVPSEGVIAVIEVKTQMTPQMAESVFKNMQSVKALDKTAFIDTDTVIDTRVNVYGGSYKLMPTMYFLFAYECADIGKVWEKLVPLQDASPLNQRIDCACFLDEGVLLNRSFDPESYSGLPSPNSLFVPGLVKQPLLLWYLLVSTYLFQFQGRPIRLKDYVPADFNL
jgi:hypothetical protein